MYHQSNSSNKQNRLTLEKRLSLKHNASMNGKATSRMSIPARRQSVATTYQISQFREMPTRDMRQARASFVSSATVQFVQPIKKQAILTNLVKKLDHQQQLKQIINSKIKHSWENTKYSKYKIDPFSSHYSENNQDLESKLCMYEQQLRNCKQLVKNLTQKITEIQKNGSIKNNIELKQVSTQTQKQIESMDISFDFMDNLDRTLKILSGNKKI